jgi:dimeric dUTPase (all-alpha-NTP-PPase superfamily)
MVTTDELQSMLEVQISTNEKFNGSDWKSVGEMKFKLALFTEVAEFLESCPKNWKWWKPWMSNNTHNMYIEVIDVLHFGLSILLMNHDINSILVDSDSLTDTNDTEIKSDNILNAYSEFYHTPTLSNFYGLINSMVVFGGLDKGKLLDIYFQKSKLNHKRVNEGYLDGIYDKYKNGIEDNVAISI